MWEQKYFAFFFHTLLVTLALMPAEWLYEKLLTEFEVQHELMILTVTFSRNQSALCVFEEHDELLFDHHIQIHTCIYLYKCI